MRFTQQAPYIDKSEGIVYSLLFTWCILSFCNACKSLSQFESLLHAAETVGTDPQRVNT